MSGGAIPVSIRPTGSAFAIWVTGHRDVPGEDAPSVAGKDELGATGSKITTYEASRISQAAADAQYLDFCSNSRMALQPCEQSRFQLSIDTSSLST